MLEIEEAMQETFVSQVNGLPNLTEWELEQKKQI
jgi:hypothetical protein